MEEGKSKGPATIVVSRLSFHLSLKGCLLIIHSELLTLRKENYQPLKQLLHIAPPEDLSQTGNALLVEIGAGYCCIARCNSKAKIISDVRYYTFDPLTINESITTLFNELTTASDTFDKVAVCFDFPQSILYPEEFYEEQSEKEMMNYMYDVGQHQILHDEIKAGKMVNFYAVPEEVYQTVTKHFPAVQFIHIYSAIVRTYSDTAGDNQMQIHFTPTSFLVKVKKGQQLLLIQTFTYVTPLDVVYVLLKINTELDLKQDDTHIVLSGLIEEDSALYKELYNYFLHLHFNTSAAYALQQSQYPEHYFTSIYSIASCVL